MSKSVDQKVVQMQFDNAQFEQGAKQSMSTLDKLKQALKFDGANKGVEELNKSIGNIDFGKAEVMATRAGFHIQDVFLKISNVLEYQIARKIINIGENVAKSLTLDQVTAGFSEYELKMGSIQTIMAGTGEKLEVVNKYLNELNEYSDKTIYSFSDMTQNIGKFTNAGVKLKDAVAAIQGVANVAAVSGANANEASRAMYNFAQALSAGYVKLIDWKSIENANMATVEFKDTLLQTAVAMGYAKDNGDGMYKILTKNAQGKTMDSAISATKNFNDSLAYQWMKTNVLTQALEIYSKDVRTMTDAEKDAYEEKLRGQGFTDKQIEQFEELGIKATKAASEVKTFSQLMDTIKESIGSGWAMSFEHIIGNFEEAKQLFTEVNDEVGVIIAKIDNQRNKMLENWKKMGGRDDLIQAFRNIAGAIGDIINPIKDVFNQIFPPMTSVRLVEITKKFKDWTASLRLNKEQQEELRVTLHYLLTPVKILVEVLKFVVKLIPPIVSAGFGLLKVIISITAAIINLVRNKVFTPERMTKLNSAVVTLKNTLVAIANTLKSTIASAVKGFINLLKDENSWLNKTINLFKALGAITLAGLRTAFNSIANFKFSNIVSWLDKTKTKLKEIGDSNKFVKVLLDAFNKVKDVLKVVGDAFGVFFESLKSRLEKAESFGDFLKAIWDSLKEGYDFLKEFIESKFFTEGPGLFDKIKTAFSTFIDILTGGMEKIPWAKLVLIAFTLALATCTINLVTAISRFGGLAVALKETVNIINTTIKTFTGLRNRLIELKEIAIFITAITAAVGIFALIDAKYGNLTKAAATLGILAAGLMILAEAMLWINTKNALAPASLASLMASIGALVAGTAVLVAAAAALKEMSLSFKEALPYIETLGLLMLGMLAAMTVLTLIGKDKKIFTAGAMAILSYAGAVYILAKGLTELAQVEFVDVNGLLKLLLAFMAGFSAITALAGKFGSFAGFASILAMAFSFKYIVQAIQDLGRLHMSESAKELTSQLLEFIKYMTTVIGLVVVLVKIFGQGSIKTKIIQKHANKFKIGFNNLSLNLLAISASILMIGKAFEILNRNLQTSKDWGNFLGILGIFAGIITVLALVFRAINKTEVELKNKNALVRFAGSILALGLALAPLALVLDLLSSIVANHDGKDIAIASGIIAGLGVLMGGLMWASGQASFTDFKVLLTIFASFSVLLAELIAVSMLVKEHGWEMVAGLGLMAGIVTLMWAAVKALTSPKIHVTGYNIKPLITVVSGMVVLAGVLTGLAFLIDSGASVWQALGLMGAIAGGLVIVFAGFAAVKKWIGEVGSVIKPILTITGSMVALVGILVGLALIIEQHGNAITQALKTMGAIGLGLAALYAIFAVIDTYSKGSNWATLLSFGAVIAVVAGGLFLLAQVPWQSLAAAGGVIFVFTALMVGLAAALGVINLAIPGSVVVFNSFATAIGILVGAFALLVGAAALFINAVSRVVEALTELGMNGDQVAIGIKKAGHAISQEIEEIARSVQSSAPRLAKAAAMIMVGIAKGINEGSKYIALAIAQVIQILMPVIAEAFQTLLNILIDSLDKILEQLLSTSTKFYEMGMNLLSNFISGLLGNGEIAQVASAWITEMIAALIPGVGQIFNIGHLFKQNFLAGATPSAGELKVVEESYEMAGANSAGAMYKGAVRELTLDEKNLKKKAESVPASVQNAIAKESKKGSKVAQQYTKDFANGFYAGWSDVDRFLHESKSKVTNWWDSISDKGLVQTATDAFGSLKDNVVGYFQDMVPSFDEFGLNLDEITEAAEDATPAMNGLGEAAEDAGNKAKKGAKSAKEAADEISSFVEKMEGSFNILDEFDLGLDEENPLTGDKLISNMRSNVDGMVQWSHEMKSISDKVAQGLYKKLADMGPQGYKYVHAFAQMTAEQLDEVNKLYSTSLVIPTSVTAEIYQGMNLAANNAYTGFVNGLHIEEFQTLGINLATGFLTGLTDPAGLDTHSPSKKTTQIGIYATQGLTNGINDSSAKEGLFYTIRRMCLDILTKFKTGLSAQDFKDVGQQVIRGLINGLNDEKARNELSRSVDSLTNAITVRTTTNLKIKSPSRVFAKIGEYLDEGLAVGIIDNVSVVESSVDKLAEATVENMKSAVDTIQNVINSDIDVEPVIRPVVDMSNATAGMTNLNSLMTSTFGSNVSVPQANFMTTSQLISNTDNTSVVDAIGGLQEDVVNLKDAMTNIKMVLDTGTMVGAMTPAIDMELGSRQILAGRGI